MLNQFQSHHNVPKLLEMSSHNICGRLLSKSPDKDFGKGGGKGVVGEGEEREEEVDSCKR